MCAKKNWQPIRYIGNGISNTFKAMFPFERLTKDYRLEIEPVIQRAKEVKESIHKELVQHSGIRQLSLQVLRAAEKSKEVSEQSSHPLAFHKIPLYLLILVVIWCGYWIYCHFYHVSTVRFAIQERDTSFVTKKIGGRLALEFIPDAGSVDGLKMLEDRKADVCFVQGGVEIPETYHRLTLPEKETILFLLKKGKNPQEIQQVLTSVEGQGSHLLAAKILEILGKQNISFIHDWTKLTDDSSFVIPENIDAVLVSKSLLEAKNLKALKRLFEKGFVVQSLDLGIWGDSQSYLQRARVRTGYFLLEPSIPDAPKETYLVNTYLVSHHSFNPIKLRAIANLFYPKDILQSKDEEAAVKDFLERADAFSQIFMSAAFFLIALFGIGVLAHRRRFNELNTLISLINIHQSAKDLYDESDPEVCKRYRHYLAYCSDLLGIIDVITGYYAQEDSTLLFNGFCSVIHQRCMNLKVNIQLKIHQSALKHLETIASK
ncbi:MAG: hypothetical protein HUU50_07150 [Candidatus Brocadiae bacterium]|nr:hypothetical protein [Candidatus Brocadiia bacterium]